MNQWLKFGLEMGPLLVFFGANAKWGILTGTMVFVVATAVALTTSYVLVRKIPILPLVSGVFVLTFGGLTVWLEDDLFIKLKPTVVNALLGLALIGGLLSGRNFLRLVFEAAFKLTEEGWRILAWRWAFFFLLLAVINEVVWRTQTTDAWVSFKVFGIMPLTVLFSLAQLPLLMRHQAVEEGGTT
ncbi:septation protein A [Novispirillum sp. DQ9]|uniref:septation protein A n=1 Tax=Novispirillum sp. DQ9 TaxID=3398612 RepID=UPI003C7B07E0